MLWNDNGETEYTHNNIQKIFAAAAEDRYAADAMARGGARTCGRKQKKSVKPP